MADISLTASMRTNLLSLQNTQSLMDMTQERLSTGYKVNSAIDNPSSYYTARSLNNRASDLNSLLDSMGQGIQTISAANEGIESITGFVEQAKALINTARDTGASKAAEDTVDAKTFTFDDSADADPATAKLSLSLDGAAPIEIEVDIVDKSSTTKDVAQLVANINAGLQASTDAKAKTISAKVSGNAIVLVSSDKNLAWSMTGTVNGIDMESSAKSATPNTRTSSQAQYKEVLSQINQLAKDSGYKGVNLLQQDNLTVNFNEDRSSSLTVNGVKADVEGLELVESGDWDNEDNVALEASLIAVDNAIATLRTWASELGNNYAILQSREDFTEKLVNVLTEGADKLTLADMNEESANMLALQTRQQLAINSLSLASQAAQSVLKLF